MRTAASPTRFGCITGLPGLDPRGDLGRIQAPMLMVTTDAGGLGTVGDGRARQEPINSPGLMVLPGDSYHVAATHAEHRAAAALDSIWRHEA